MPRKKLLPPPPKLGTVESALKVVDSFCRGPEHNDFYEVEPALHLALALLPPSGRKRFERLFVEFRAGGKFSGITDFVRRKPVKEIIPAPPRPRGGYWHADISG